jgi:hypothetical protein
MKLDSLDHNHIVNSQKHLTCSSSFTVTFLAAVTLQSLGPCTPCPAVNARAAVHLKSTSLPHFGELAQVSRCSRKAEFDVQVFKKS